MATRCVRCHSEFSDEHVGSHGCYVHPGKFDTSTQHYKCCGATRGVNMCKTHSETHFPTPYGCHRADHIGTFHDNAAVLRDRPFVIAPLDKVRECLPYARTPNGETVFHFEAENDMPHDFRVTVPKAWMGEDAIRGELDVNLCAEHDAMRQAIVDMEGKALARVTDDPYTAEWERHAAQSKDVQTPSFVPFALIMRIAITPDADRAVDKDAACVM